MQPSFANQKSALVLAPMEGVTDAPMREFLSAWGGYTYCVTEFIRISESVPHVKTFKEMVPELSNGSMTKSGIPVQIQLLGGNAERLAESAARACAAGAKGIDLNFGCPAPTVNSHDGGATLLKYPKRIFEIVTEVRKAVPHEHPVSVKMRLGWDSHDPIHANTEMAALAGASWITIHGRSKTQGYIPPAYWEPIGEVKRRLNIPIIANGEIWSIDDFKRCRDITRCEHFMIGRGALANPSLSHQISSELGLTYDENKFIVSDWNALFRTFEAICLNYVPNKNYTLRRIKQWISIANKANQLQWAGEAKRALNLDELYSKLSSARTESSNSFFNA